MVRFLGRFAYFLEIIKKAREQDKEITVTDVYKVTGVTMGCVRDTVLEMEEVGWVNRKKKGRVFLLTLTEKGEEVAQAVDTIKKNMQK